MNVKSIGYGFIASVSLALGCSGSDEAQGGGAGGSVSMGGSDAGSVGGAGHDGGIASSGSGGSGTTGAFGGSGGEGALGSGGVSGSASTGGGSGGASGSHDNPFMAQGDIPAFPGAEGYGALAASTCDRTNVQILRVTNTNDTGAGSLRAELSKADPSRLTIVMFSVGGAISGGSHVLKPQHNCLYIAGQTAPGGGVQIHNPNGAGTWSLDRTGPSDIVVRYVRFRSSKGVGGQQDVVSINGGERIIFDHASAQFGNDEVFEIYPVNHNGQDVRYVTMQNSLFAAGLNPHSTGALIDGASDRKNEDISLHHNFFSDNSHRNPNISDLVQRIQVINNVTYNYKGQPAETGGSMPTADFIGNYWKVGPWSRQWAPCMHLTYGKLINTGVLYAEGNLHTHLLPNPSGDQNQLFIFSGSNSDAYPNYQPIPKATFRSTPSANPKIPVTVQTAQAAYTSVLASVGASQRIDCKGDWVSNRDKLDSLFVNSAQNDTGSGSDADHDDPSDFGGIPNLATGQGCADGDNDGMPDAFEQRYGLNLNDASDASKDDDGDGYVNVEEYVNGTQPK